MGLGTQAEQRAAYFARSFKAVDGLWFMMVEEEHGFDEALRIDEAVWRVLPKIQARRMRELLGQGQGLAALRECLTTHLAWEGHAIECALDEQGGHLDICIRDCPWLALLRKSNREHLAEQIGPRICTAEYSTWGAEFGEEICFRLGETVCQGAEDCLLQYRIAHENADCEEIGN